MSSPVPTPVAAALGIVPAVLSGVRSLPGKAVQLPVLCVSSALTGLDRTRRGYDDLADRGERLIARLRGTSFDELEDGFEDALQGTPLAAPYDKVEDALEDVAENVTAFVRSTPARARKAAGKVDQAVTEAKDTAADAAVDLKDGAVDLKDDATRAGADVKDGVADAADTVLDATAEAKDTAADAAADLKDGAVEAVNDAEAAKGAPTPKATQPDTTPVETAATPEVVKTVEAVTADVGGKVVDRDDLPLADFDHLTLGAVRGRMRSLDLPQLVQLRDYEKSKANRLPIVTMLDNRIAKLATDPTATPSDGDAAAPKTPAKRAKKTAGKVSPATANEGVSAPGAAFGGLGTSVPGKG